MGNTKKAINEVAEELSTQAISQADTGEPNTRVQIASKSKRKGCFKSISQGVLFLHVPSMGCASSAGDFVHGGHVSRGEGSAIATGDFSLGNANTIGATMEALVLLAIQPRVGSFSAAATSFATGVCSAFADGGATPFGDLGEGRKRHFLWRFRRRKKTPLPLAF
ncbi:hypothetical protein HKD37_13G035424 [Glycine soja]